MFFCILRKATNNGGAPYRSLFSNVRPLFITLWRVTYEAHISPNGERLQSPPAQTKIRRPQAADGLTRRAGREAVKNTSALIYPSPLPMSFFH